MAMFQVLICFICLDQLLALHLTVCLKKKNLFKGEKMGESVASVFLIAGVDLSFQ